MICYCVKCKKNTESKNFEDLKTKKADEQCFYQSILSV